MKNKFLSIYTFAMIAVFAVASVMTSCKNDDDDDDDTPSDVVVEDGFYIKGDGTAYTELGVSGFLDKGINEANQEEKEGLYEKYFTVKAGDGGFNLVVVEGGTEKVYGPGTNEVVSIDGSDYQIVDDIQRGEVAENAGEFTVPEDGMYHFVYDETTSLYMIIPANFWEVNNYGEMTAGEFGKDEMSWTLSSANLTKMAKFKFRHSEGWKVIVGADVAGSEENAFNINTNFGGTIEGDTIDGISLTIEPGGGDYEVADNQTGKYDFTFTWTAEDGWSSTLERKGDAVETIPEELYVTGEALGGWDWTDNHEQMTSTGNGVFELTTDLVKDGAFRFFAQADWGPNDYNYPYFEGGTIDELLENAEDGDSNFKFIGDDGSYTITVNFVDTSVDIEPAK